MLSDSRAIDRTGHHYYLRIKIRLAFWRVFVISMKWFRWWIKRANTCAHTHTHTQTSCRYTVRFRLKLIKRKSEIFWDAGQFDKIAIKKSNKNHSLVHVNAHAFPTKINVICWCCSSFQKNWFFLAKISKRNSKGNQQNYGMKIRINKRNNSNYYSSSNNNDHSMEKILILFSHLFLTQTHTHGDFCSVQK